MEQHKVSRRGQKNNGRVDGGLQDEAGDNLNCTIKFTRPPPVAGKIKNYAVMNLDEPATAALLSWRSTIRQFRLWCYNTSPDRFRFGDERRRSCRLPEGGHFIVYIQYHNNWMAAIINGPTGYLDGYVIQSEGKDKKIQENRIPAGEQEKGKVRRCGSQKNHPEYIEGADLLPWSGAYQFAARVSLGYQSLVGSFNTMYRRVGRIGPSPSRDDVVMAGECFILHLPEAGRSDKLYMMASTNFIDGIELGPTPLQEARAWSGRTIQAFKSTEDVTPDKWAAKKKAKGERPEELYCYNGVPFKAELESDLEILEDLRLFYREDPKRRRFELVDLPVRLGREGPLSDALDTELTEDEDEHKDSLFLVQPFLRFNRNKRLATGEANNDLEKTMDSADGSDERHASNGTSETEHLGLGMHKEELPELEYHVVALTESLKITADKCETSKGSATICNLGNTCYASCTLQYCRAVPELRFELRRYLKGSRNPNVAQSLHELMNALHDAIARLGDSDKPFRPEKFVKILRQVYQDFQETEDGLYKQQDMAECLSRMIETLSVTLRREESGSVLDPVKAIFGIEMISRGEKLPTTVYQLNCAVNDQIDDLDQGLEKVLRLANSKISKLPPYLTIQFHRVIHEGKAGRAIKTLQKVGFPSKLDMHRHCSKILKSDIQGKRKLSKAGEDTGIYALIAVITHEGKTSDSGHYRTFVKQDDTWIHFDDEKKFTTTENDVLKLCGGCDGPMACICLYKSDAGKGPYDYYEVASGDEKSLDKGDTGCRSSEYAVKASRGGDQSTQNSADKSDYKLEK